MLVLNNPNRIPSKDRSEQSNRVHLDILVHKSLSSLFRILFAGHYLTAFALSHYLIISLHLTRVCLACLGSFLPGIISLRRGREEQWSFTTGGNTEVEKQPNHFIQTIFQRVSMYQVLLVVFHGLHGVINVN